VEVFVLFVRWLEELPCKRASAAGSIKIMSKQSPQRICAISGVQRALRAEAMSETKSPEHLEEHVAGAKHTRGGGKGTEADRSAFDNISPVLVRTVRALLLLRPSLSN
jgi:hypothetical protein